MVYKAILKKDEEENAVAVKVFHIFKRKRENKLLFIYLTCKFNFYMKRV